MELVTLICCSLCLVMPCCSSLGIHGVSPERGERSPSVFLAGVRGAEVCLAPEAGEEAHLPHTPSLLP